MRLEISARPTDARSIKQVSRCLPRDATSVVYVAVVCLAVCLSQAGIVQKLMNGSSWFQACQLSSTCTTLNYINLYSPKKRQQHKNTAVQAQIQAKRKQRPSLSQQLTVCTGVQTLKRNTFIFRNNSTFSSSSADVVDYNLSNIAPKTFFWNFVANGSLRKLRHGKSIVLSTELVDGRACWPHVRRPNRRALTYILHTCSMLYIYVRRP